MTLDEDLYNLRLQQLQQQQQQSHQQQPICGQVPTLSPYETFLQSEGKPLQRLISAEGNSTDTSTTAPTSTDASVGTTTTTTSSCPGAGVGVKGLTGRLPIQLYLSCNDDYMSQYQCIVRKQIEFFEATAIDTGTIIQGRNKPIVLGQVGIRCRHCARQLPNQRPNGSTYYPTKLQGIYQASQNMAQIHLLETCTFIPASVRTDLLRLREESTSKKRRVRATEKSAPGGGKQFWATTAQSLGVYEDTDSDILRFDPCWSIKILQKHANEEKQQKELAKVRQQTEQELLLGGATEPTASDEDDDEYDDDEFDSDEGTDHIIGATSNANHHDDFETGSISSFTVNSNLH